MIIAYTHNLQRDRSAEQAEFDSAETVALIVEALRSKGHTVIPVDVARPVEELVAELRRIGPDLIFNTAEGHRGRFREAFYPALFDQLGIPYTGADAYACALTLDKHLTKVIVAARGVPTPRALLIEQPGDLDGHHLRLPVIVKPNFEGSSIGIGDDSVVEGESELCRRVADLLARYPSGVLVEEFIEGLDLVVPFLELSAPETHGVLEPVLYDYPDAVRARRKFQIYDFSLKSSGFSDIVVRSPSGLAPEICRRAQELAWRVFATLKIRDVGRIDLRVTPQGELYFLEVNALPSLEKGASVYRAAVLAGLPREADVLEMVVQSASQRWSVERGILHERASRVVVHPAEHNRAGGRFDAKHS
jgi:D-alanine-D-alanine ligase